MNEFPKLKINSFRVRNIFFKDEDKKNIIISLDKNSLFLKKIIEIKKKEQNSSTKIFKNPSLELYNIDENCKNSESLAIEKIQRIYKNPKYFQQVLNETKAEYPTKRYKNNSSYFSKSPYQIKNNSNSNERKKVNFSFYQNYVRNNLLIKNPTKSCHSLNISNRNNSKDLQKCKTESRVLSFNGTKMFSSLSFCEDNNKTIDNSSKLNVNKSELYRNYVELNLKKERIYKRKLKKNMSEEKRQILKSKILKEIKQQTIQNITNNQNPKKIDFLKKINKIPKGNKTYKNINKTNNSIIENNLIEQYDNSKNIKINQISKKLKEVNKLIENDTHQSSQNDLSIIQNKNNMEINKNKKLCFKHVIIIKNNKKNNVKRKNHFNNYFENKENLTQNYINKNINKKRNQTQKFLPPNDVNIKKIAKKYFITDL